MLTGDAHAADDLLQEALTRVAGRWRRVAASGDPEAYVRRVLYTTHVSWWRRRRSQTALVSGGEEPRRVDEAEGATQRLLLESALTQLTSKQRAVLVLRYYEDLTEASTAALLGVSVSTVKSQAAHALARLRQLSGVDLADLRGRPVPTHPAARVPAQPKGARR